MAHQEQSHSLFLGLGYSMNFWLLGIDDRLLQARTWREIVAMANDSNAAEHILKKLVYSYWRGRQMVDDIIQLSHEFLMSKFGHMYGQTSSVSFSFCYIIAIL